MSLTNELNTNLRFALKWALLSKLLLPYSSSAPSDQSEASIVVEDAGTLFSSIGFQCGGWNVRQGRVCFGAFLCVMGLFVKPQHEHKKKKKGWFWKGALGVLKVTEKRREETQRQCWCNTAASLHWAIFIPPCVTLAYWPSEPCQEGGGGVRWKVWGAGVQNLVTHNVSSEVTTGKTWSITDSECLHTASFITH